MYKVLFLFSDFLFKYGNILKNYVMNKTKEKQKTKFFVHMVFTGTRTGVNGDFFLFAKIQK